MKPADRILNLLTVVVLGLTVISGLCIGTVFLNPLGVFNFLGPATMPAPLGVPTLGASSPSDATATPLVFPTFPPEWTATITPTSTDSAPTDTPPPTDTDQPQTITDATRTPFPTPVRPTETLTPEEPPTSTATVPPPTRTSTPGPYPGQIPTATQTPPTAYP